MLPTGTGTLVRLVLRRDRVRLSVWVVSINVLVVVSAISVIDLYRDPATLRSAAESLRGNRAMLAMNGPAVALDTLGGRTVFELGAFGYVIVALMNVFLVARHTRGEEEAGTAELVRAAAVDPRSPIVATLLVATGANVVIGVASALSLVLSDLPVTGSCAFGAAMTAVGITFAALTLVTAQVSAHTRAVTGLSCGAVAFAYALRAIGDTGPDLLSWLSPIGWGQAVRAYGGERWWVLLVPAVTTLLLFRVTTSFGRRRDHGAGLVQPRPGPPHAPAALSHPVVLAWRLQRTAVAGWAVAMFIGGVAYGSVAKDIDDYVRDNPDIADFLAKTGGSLVDTYLGTTLLLLSVVAAGFAVSSVLRLRSEEMSGRAEVLLAGSLGRVRWAAAGVVVAAVSSAVLVVLAGAGAGLAYGITVDDAGQLPRVALASLTQIPGVWALGAAALALHGLRPRAAVAAWAALAVTAVIAMFAELLDLPRTVRNVSPFEHLPRSPAGELHVLPIVVVLLVCGALVAAGLAGLRRRDLGGA
jgi:ABC-2 type transport system permease protein